MSRLGPQRRIICRQSGGARTISATMPAAFSRTARRSFTLAIEIAQMSTNGHMTSGPDEEKLNFCLAADGIHLHL
jgi:hypothetical protein